jgi:hypothetical protein
MAARNLDGELDGVGTPRSVAEPISVGIDTFVQRFANRGGGRPGCHAAAIRTSARTIANYNGRG